MSRDIQIPQTPGKRRTDSIVILCPPGEIPTVEFRRGVYEVSDGVIGRKLREDRVSRAITPEFLQDATQSVSVGGLPVSPALIMAAMAGIGDKWDAEDFPE